MWFANLLPVWKVADRRRSNPLSDLSLRMRHTKLKHYTTWPYIIIDLCSFQQASFTYLSDFDKFCLLFPKDKRRQIPADAIGQRTTLRLDTGWENKTMCSAWRGRHPENEWSSFQTVMCYAWWLRQHASLRSTTTPGGSAWINKGIYQ